MWELLVFGTIGGAAVGFSILQSRKRLRNWEGAATSCGLEVVAASGVVRPVLEARAGRMAVRIETCGNKGESTRVVVVASRFRDFRSVRIRPESFFPFREVKVGDPPFDSTFAVEGPKGTVLALFDAETRRRLRRVDAEARLELHAGELRAEMRDEEKVSIVLPALLDLGQLFSQPIDIPRRLAENARHDPEPGVRIQNLLALIRDHPEDPGTLEALRASCLDVSYEVRLRAARELGDEGRDVLLKLAEGPAPDAVSAEALSALGPDLPFEQARFILDRALRVGRIQTARLCLEVLGRHGAVAVDLLVEVLEWAKGELAVAAAQALGETGSPAAEPPLILALRREDKDLRVATANALGRVGSVEAVLPLKEAAESSWLHLSLRQAARQSIAEIQSRVQGASPGQLSLAQAEAGQLSLSTESAGQLSLGDAGDEPEEA